MQVGEKSIVANLRTVKLVGVVILQPGIGPFVQAHRHTHDVPVMVRPAASEIGVGQSAECCVVLQVLEVIRALLASEFLGHLSDFDAGLPSADVIYFSLRRIGSRIGGVVDPISDKKDRLPKNIRDTQLPQNIEVAIVKSADGDPELERYLRQRARIHMADKMDTDLIAQRIERGDGTDAMG